MSNKPLYKDPVWQDTLGNGSRCDFYGITIVIEDQHGAVNGPPLWTVVPDSRSNFGYQRGGREGERTLADIKKLAIVDAKAYRENKYAHACYCVAEYEKAHYPNGKE